jgi:excisionase family DNA binding protein
MLTIKQAAVLLGLSPSTLRVQVRNGKLRARKVGTVLILSEREVERYRAVSKGTRAPK